VHYVKFGGGASGELTAPQRFPELHAVFRGSSLGRREDRKGMELKRKHACRQIRTTGRRLYVKVKQRSCCLHDDVNNDDNTCLCGGLL